MKGIMQNIMPFSEGWAVCDNVQPEVLRCFESQEAAVTFAQARATDWETAILIHNQPLSETDRLQVLMMPCG